MAHNPNNPNNIATMANSYPVTIATDQSTNPAIVNGPAITVGTQHANGFTVQSQRNAGRTAQRYYAVDEAGNNGILMMTLTKSSGTAATSTASTFAITNGKIFRIQHIALGIRSTSSSNKTCTFSIHVDTASTAGTADPIMWSARVSVVGGDPEWQSEWFEFPEGYDIPGTSTLQWGLSQTTSSSSCTVDAMIIGYEY